MEVLSTEQRALAPDSHTKERQSRLVTMMSPMALLPGHFMASLRLGANRQGKAGSKHTGSYFWNTVELGGKEMNCKLKGMDTDNHINVNNAP